MLQTSIPKTAAGNRFVSLDPKTKTHVIESGLRMLDAEHTCVEQLGSEQWTSRLDELKEVHKLAMLNKDAEHRAQLERLENHISETRELHKSAIRTAVAEADTRRQAAEDLCSSQVTEIHRLNQTLFDKVKFEVQQVRDEYEKRLTEAADREKETRDTLAAMVVRKTKSTTKGADGEATMVELLHRCFPTAEIEDCSGKPGLGDFVLLDADVCMMVEAKNYKRNVAKAEIDKFMRDMENNPNYTCGILASLESGISGFPDFTLGTVASRPVVYLHNVIDNPEKLQYAYAVFEMIHSIENLDLGKQSVLEAVNREIADKQRRTRALRTLAEKQMSEIDAWIEIDDARALATLRTIATQTTNRTI